MLKGWKFWAPKPCHVRTQTCIYGQIIWYPLQFVHLIFSYWKKCIYKRQDPNTISGKGTKFLPIGINETVPDLASDWLNFGTFPQKP